MAVLHVFFASTQYTANQRGELFGFTELLCELIETILNIN